MIDDKDSILVRKILAANWLFCSSFSGNNSWQKKEGACVEARISTLKLLWQSKKLDWNRRFLIVNFPFVYCGILSNWDLGKGMGMAVTVVPSSMHDFSGSWGEGGRMIANLRGNAET